MTVCVILYSRTPPSLYLLYLSVNEVEEVLEASWDDPPQLVSERV